MNIDPKTVKIQGDLSRSDVINLCRLCDGKRVVEFGMGGSTLLLARCCATLDSYDTSEEWYNRITAKVSQIPNKTCEPKLTLGEQVPEDIPSCDVLWIDGCDAHRGLWLEKFFDKAPLIIVHDGRRPWDVSQVFEVVRPNFSRVKTLHINYDESNLLLIEKRLSPLEWENWNVTERDDNRANPWASDFAE